MLPEVVLEVLRHGTGGSRAVDLLPDGGSTAAVGVRVHPLLGKDASIAFAGLISPGLFQFNVVVPNIPNNDLAPLTYNLNGTASTQTLFLAVHN